MWEATNPVLSACRNLAAAVIASAILRVMGCAAGDLHAAATAACGSELAVSRRLETGDSRNLSELFEES